MAKNSAKPIVFITGTFIGSNCWDVWKAYFEHKGYNCIAPAWPHKDTSPEELRNRHPDSAIASNRLTTLTDYFAGIVNALPDRPIMIGHSLGGLIVQLLLQRGFGTAGVALHSFPPAGVRASKFLLLRALWRTLDLFTSRQQTYMISFKRWKYTIANGMTCDEQKESFYKYATPESKLIISDAFKCAAKIHFDKKRLPLLLISGSNDRLVSPSINFDNYKNYQASDSITEYKNFAGRNHLFFGHPEWTNEADFILYWLQGLN